MNHFFKAAFAAAVLMSSSAASAAAFDPTTGGGAPCTTCGGAGASGPFTVENTAKANVNVSGAVSNTDNSTTTNTSGSTSASTSGIGDINANNIYKGAKNLSFGGMVSKHPGSAAALCGVIMDSLSGQVGPFGLSKSKGQWDEQCRTGQNINLVVDQYDRKYQNYLLAIQFKDAKQVRRLAVELASIETEITYAFRTLNGFKFEDQDKGFKGTIDNVSERARYADTLAVQAGVSQSDVSVSNAYTAKLKALMAIDTPEARDAIEVLKEEAARFRVQQILNAPIVSVNTDTVEGLKILMERAHANGRSNEFCKGQWPTRTDYFVASNGQPYYCKPTSESIVHSYFTSKLKRAGHIGSGKK